MQVGLSDVQRSIVYYTQLRVVSLSTYNFTTCLAAISLSYSLIVLCRPPPPLPLAPLQPGAALL